MRLMPSDPRFPAYDEAQRTYTVALNWHMHHDIPPRGIDLQMWRHVYLPALLTAMRVEMSAIARSGLDG